MTDDLFSVSGKVALVTGDDRGAAVPIVRSLVEAGARVYVTSPDGVAAEKVAAELASRGDCRPLAADVSSEAGCRVLAEEFGRVSEVVHLLVNNVGAVCPSPFTDFGGTGRRETFTTNLEAARHLTRFLRPQLAAASTPGDPARVVCVGSIDDVWVPVAEMHTCEAGRAVMHDLTRQLASRLAPRITVNSLVLGPFAAAVVERELTGDGGARSAVRGRGGTDGIGGIVRFLGSRASACITGTVVPVDGGMLAAS